MDLTIFRVLLRLRASLCVNVSLSAECAIFQIVNAPAPLASNARCSSRIVRRARLIFLNYDYEL